MRRRTGARLAVALLAAAAVALLSARAAATVVAARHRPAAAAAVVAAPDAVAYRLPAVRGAPPGVGGGLYYRRGVWLAVIDLHGLPPVDGRERYLVFLRNWTGWTLAGAARPDAAGAARLPYGAEPRPATIFEVVVTRAVDDAGASPHGLPVLDWYDPAIAPPLARPYDFARGGLD